MESTIVIKVKYGETLRRFTARIYENELDLDMGGLREKVISLFNFAPDTALTLTYIDEDGDVVTLVDEEDLCDVMRQSLNPLRITVKLNIEKAGRSYAQSSGSSTPMRSPQVQTPLPNLNTNIAEILKPVPEPFREALSKVSLDLASKAAYSAPGLAELVETFSKMGQSYIKSVLESQTTAEPDTHASTGKDQEASKDGGVTSEVAPNMKSEEPVSKENQNPELGNGSHIGHYTFNECPFSGMPLANDQTRSQIQFTHSLNPFRRSYIDSVFHMGVVCDGCDVNPITGPRFKSKVKEDYDLCSICFAKFGNEVDYIRMDRPVSCRRRSSSMGLYDPIKQAPMRPQTLPDVLRSCGMKSKGPKLESRFIRDVNIPDGTVMAPSTPFTKVWRMRNNGSVLWPRGTQLVWIGGDKLSNTLSVEIPADGLAVENELDLAVYFTAPELPGRYISHWRMASPTGQKFGQRVWVDIQVDAALQDSSCVSLQFLNLNLPPESNDITGPEMISVGAEPKSNDATELVKPIVEPKRKEEFNFPINDTLLVGPSEASSPVSYPIIIDLPEVVPTAPYDEPLPNTNGPAPESVPEVGESNAVEQTLLRELKEMGFKQVDLNKEILRMNEYDLERSVDDLCGVAEWDPILEELQEMGFCDKETNQRLLKKNNGSIKRVVMDLIAGE